MKRILIILALCSMLIACAGKPVTVTFDGSNTLNSVHDTMVENGIDPYVDIDT